MRNDPPTFALDPRIAPPCDCRGKDCTLQFDFRGSKYSKYRVTRCLTHGTIVYQEPISVKVVFDFGNGLFIEEVL